MTAQQILALAQTHRKEPSLANYQALADAVKAVVAERDEALQDAAKSKRRANTFGGTIHNFALAMSAALIEADQHDHREGMQWIWNTLAGPGLLPDFDEAKAMGSAQAWFDAKTAEEDARLAALKAAP